MLLNLLPSCSVGSQWEFLLNLRFQISPVKTPMNCDNALIFIVLTVHSQSCKSHWSCCFPSRSCTQAKSCCSKQFTPLTNRKRPVQQSLRSTLLWSSLSLLPAHILPPSLSQRLFVGLSATLAAVWLRWLSSFFFFFGIVFFFLSHNTCQTVELLK